ncbi:MAG: chemotaxis protein CheB [Planctomycetes bacterium]|nr:chemotaxis protein CheB [Planctomycetota bacterium]
MKKAKQHCDLVVIGASAGGVLALRGLLEALPERLEAAVLIAMHIGEGRTSILAEALQRFTSMPIADAVDGERLELGRLYVAIADNQLTVEPGIVRVLPMPKEGPYRPCIDTLFRSAAAVYGKRVVGVVLSGMLSDGTAGLVHITEGGGITVVQDPAEAKESSMPENAIIGDHVQYRLPVRDIAHLLVKLTGGSPDSLR